MVNNKWGYMDQHGEMIIEPKFDKVTNFENGEAEVEISWQWRTIDKTGNFID